MAAEGESCDEQSYGDTPVGNAEYLGSTEKYSPNKTAMTKPTARLVQGTP